MENLADLDALLLKVRDHSSRRHLDQAIKAYHGGAYRAAIISTWIAVVYDIIEKIRELDAYGDAQARVRLDELDRNIQSGNIPKLSGFEDSLLGMADEEFELLSSEQTVRLKRLKDDRNFCAHPAFTSTGVPFEPTAELVRSHIVHAVMDLMQHGPVRGKSSLDAIMADIASSVFPITSEAAAEFLNKKYLRYAKVSLLENLLKVLIKAATGKLTGWPRALDHAVFALKAVSLTRPKEFENWMAANLVRFVDGLDEEQIPRLFGLIRSDRRYWAWIADHHRLQLEGLLEKVAPMSMQQMPPAEELSGWGVVLGVFAGIVHITERSRFTSATSLPSLESIFELTDIEQLRPGILKMMSALSYDEKIKVISQAPQAHFAEEAVNLYKEAGSFRGAEKLGTNVILPMAPYFTSAQLNAVFNAVLQNGQIYAAGGTDRILAELLESLSGREDLELGTLLSWDDFFAGLTDKYDNYEEFEAALKKKDLL